MRRILFTAMLLGLLGGVVAAYAVPKTKTRTHSVNIAPERKPSEFAMRVVVRHGSLRTELRRDDPGGGPEWVIRSFAADLRDPSGMPSRGSSGNQLYKHPRFCVQLGRMVDGRFGWIDGTSTFRPVGFALEGAPITCSNSEPGPGRQPTFTASTLVRGIDSPTATLLRTVAWGYGGAAAARRVPLQLGGAKREASTNSHGAFIEFAAPSIGPGDVHATFLYPGRPPRTVAGDEWPHGAIGNGPVGRARSNPPLVEARVVDPDGGVPYGIAVVPSKRGGWCVSSEGRVIDGHIGALNYQLGFFTKDVAYTRTCTDSPRVGDILKRFGVNEGYGFQSGGDFDPRTDDGAGRRARRTLTGRTEVSGIADPSIVSLTIATPRDVRTVVPSKRAHAFLAVYDGDFPTGAIVTTAHYRDGHSKKVDSFEVGGM